MPAARGAAEDGAEQILTMLPLKRTHPLAASLVGLGHLPQAALHRVPELPRDDGRMGGLLRNPVFPRLAAFRPRALLRPDLLNAAVSSVAPVDRIP